jgi:hypothetical protein
MAAVGETKIRGRVRATLVVLCAIVAGAWAAAPPDPPARLATLLVRVVDAASREPIPNAQVTDLDSAVQRLTNARGEAWFDWSGRPAIHVLVRQLGYRLAERVVSAADGAIGTTVVALERVPFVLPEQRAVAVDRCDLRTDSATQELSLYALSQLRLAAEHYEQFRRTYPFRLRSERQTVVFSRRANVPVRRTISRERTRSDEWGDPYEPGNVLHRERLGFSASLLFVSSLADSAFWDRHCLVARAVERREGQPWLRLDFAPARDVRTPDWAGSAWLDSASSVLRRVEFRLTGLTAGDSPRRLEGYTTFNAPSPFITIPDSSVAYWWRSGPTSEPDWGTPDVLQLIRITEIEYTGARPPPP